MPIKLAFAAYAISDVPRARSFYTDVVGLTPGEAFGENFIEFDLGNATFAAFAEDPDGNSFQIHQLKRKSRPLV